jgi:ATP-dependent RNA helicase HrpA
MPGDTLVDLNLEQCLLRDRGRFVHRLGQIKSRQRQGKPFDKSLARLREELELSEQLVARRRASLPTITYPEGLPVAARRDDISNAIKSSQVVVIAGETGSGKTTQIPKICLELGRGIRGRIGHTQPRRIAARTVADRIAEELNTELGNQVGYQVRFADHATDNTLIKLMTDGVLLAEIQSDPLLLQYDTIIIDEAHERSLNIDFLLGYIKQILPRRPDLKLIITSATIDVDRFARHFSEGETRVPVISVSGRTYPVEIRYRPPVEADDDSLNGLVEAVEELLALPQRGDILVFLSGEREIREASAALRHANLRHIEVLPLYARLSLNEQGRIFQPHKGTRIVLATNVAETSITVPGIRYVIDTGVARISRYSYRTKVQRLPIEPISQASANQRAGRCGRLSDGVCIRLYGEDDFSNRPKFTDPEIVRTNLAAVILQMLQMKIGDIHEFPFVDAPDTRLINDGFQLLTELKAVDSKGHLTDTGRTLSRLPVDPRLGKMLVKASSLGALRELLIITSLLSIQDPRERPADKRQAADEKHRQWHDKESDFSTLLLLWNHFEEQRQALSRRKFSEYCRQQFVSYLRMREWRDLHHQLHAACRQAGLAENKTAADYDAVHKAILSGLLSHVGFRHQEREYLGVRNRKFHIFPGSGLAKIAPKWIMAGELLETSRLFAHHVAAIRVEWIPVLADHLIKRTQIEPYYDVRRGQVMAFERQTLLGLAVVERKRVAFSHIDPVLSREIFIRGALVEGGYGKRAANAPFFEHNQRLLAELEELEDRLRRRDLVPDDDEQYAFYQERIPPGICDLKSFEYWRKSVEKQNPEVLHFDRQTWMARVHLQQAGEQFPKIINWQGVDYCISYRFQPGHQQDGVTVTVKAPQLHQVPNYLFEWLVPGLLREKCVAMVKSLPKQYRRKLVPVPDYVDKILPDLHAENTPLTQALAHQLKRHTEMVIPATAWQQEQLDDFYRVSYELTDDRGKVLAVSKNLADLKARFRDRVQKTIEEASGDDRELSDITEWSFGTLKPRQRIRRGSLDIEVFPALVAENGSVSLKLVDNQAEAQSASLSGVVQLFIQTYPDAAKYLRKHLFKGQELAFVAAGFSDQEDFRAEVIQAAYKTACLAGNPLPRTRETFESCLSQGKSRIVSTAQELEKVIVSLLPALKAVKRLQKKHKQIYPGAVEDSQQQLDFLFRQYFLFKTDDFWIRQYPRYMKGLELRLEKLPAQVDKDHAFCREIENLSSRLNTLQHQIPEADVRFGDEILEFRYLMEEYRVSIFAQILKTVKPVSAKRLQKHLDALEKEMTGG